MAGNRGLRDWIVQRVSAVYMAAYIVLLFAYFAFHPHLCYAAWQGFFRVIWVQIPTILFLLCLTWHAWIGIWTILTDYVKCTVLRSVLQVGVILLLLGYFFWGVQIVWGIPLSWSVV